MEVGERLVCLKANGIDRNTASDKVAGHILQAPHTWVLEGDKKDAEWCSLHNKKGLLGFSKCLWILIKPAQDWIVLVTWVSGSP